jgi:DNA-binding transcriptional regulator YiaG
MGVNPTTVENWEKNRTAPGCTLLAAVRKLVKRVVD